jgi:ribosome-associated protein
LSNGPDGRPPSRTQLKREAEALQSLGEALATLPAEALDGLDLPEKLRQALDELGRMSAHGALRRQRQYVGKLMRDVDPEPLRRALEASRQPARDQARRFKEAEAWRERLLEGGQEVLARFLAEHPAADADALAAALLDARAGRPGAPRRLFRRIREAMDAPRGPGGGER